MSLQQYLTILVKRWKLILTCFLLVGAGASVGTRLMTPLYQSTALVQVADSSDSVYTGLLASEQLVQTEAVLATSDSVLREVASHYKGLTAEHLSKEVTAAAKVCAEQVLEAHVQSGDLCGIVIRPFNVYGPGQRNDFVVSRFLQLAMQGLPPMVAGMGMQRRIFTFVDDLIYGMLLAVMRNRVGYHVYNIAGEGDISIAELADLIVSITGSDVRPINVQLSDLERDSATEVLVRIASAEKARRELGYRPQISLETGLKMTYAQMALESTEVKTLITIL